MSENIKQNQNVETGAHIHVDWNLYLGCRQSKQPLDKKKVKQNFGWY